MSAVVAASTPLEDEVRALFDHEPRLLADPFPLYRRLREERPVFRHGQQVLVTRHADVREVFTSPSTLQGLAAKGSRYRDAVAQLPAAQKRQMAEMFDFYEKRLAGVNGEHHTRLRKLANKAFTPRMISGMEGTIQAVLDTLLAEVAGRDTIELVDDVAYHLPLIVIAKMLDVPIEDRSRLRAWANDLGHFVGANWADAALVDRTHASVFALRDYLVRHFAAHRGRETGSLLGALLEAEADGDRFSEDELVAMVTQLIFAGHETSTNFIANSMVVLLGAERPQWEELCADPGLVPEAVEELLRHQGPTQYVDKLASEDFEIEGTVIHAWDTVSVVIAAANRDPDVYPDPDRLDIHRHPRNYLSFGFGAHFCLGAALARLEAAVALRTFARHFPEARLAGGPVEYQPNHMIRGPRHVPLVLGADHA
jgi:cytochrome P450